MRIKQEWMNLTQDEIDRLTDDDWQHYQNGGCLCYAHCECECVVVHGGSDENYDFSDCNFFVIVCDNETSQDK